VARGDLGTVGPEAGGHRVRRRFAAGVPVRQLSCRRGPLAHPEEQGTFNPKVPGSRPGRPTESQLMPLSGSPSTKFVANSVANGSKSGNSSIHEARCIASAACIRARANRWPYTSIVTRMEACPSVSETTSSGTPIASRSEAHEWRSSWMLQCPRPARLQILGTVGHSGTMGIGLGAKRVWSGALFKEASASGDRAERMSQTVACDGSP
jgi:hypothetical protein